MKFIAGLKWSVVHSFVVLVALGASMSIQSVIPLVIAVCISFFVLWLANLELLKRHRFFAGPANWITVIRLLIILGAMLNFAQMSALSLFLVLSVAVLLDVVDGFIARRFDTSSEFGALFDMEVDAFYVLVMGLFFWLTTDFGFWLLIPGALRYLYEISEALLAKDGFEQARQPLAVFLAGLNFVLLLLALVLPANYALLVLAASVMVVSYSFMRSFWSLLQHVRH